MRIWRVSTLQWIVGAFCGLMGALMLVAPHQFISMQQASGDIRLPLWGSAFLFAGIALFSISVMRPRASLVIAFHWFPGLLLLSLGISFGLTRAWIGALNYSLLGLGLIAAAYLPYAKVPNRLHRPTRPRGLIRPDLFVFYLGVCSTLTGVLMLALREQPDNPVYLLTSAIMLLYGSIFTMVGLLLALGQLSLAFLHEPRPGRAAPWWVHGPARLVTAPLDRLFYILVAVLFLFFVYDASLPNRQWLALIFYGVFGISLAALPWLLPIVQRIQANALRTQLSLILAVAMATPLILTIALITNQQEQDFKNDTLSWQREQAELQAQSLSDFIRLHQAAVQALADQPGLMENSPEQQRAEIRAFAGAYSQTAVFSLYDAAGDLVAATDDSLVVPSLASLPIFERAHQTGEPAAMIAAAGGNRPVRLRIAAPVRDEQNEFIGLAYVSIDLDRLSTSLFRTTQGPGAAFYLIDDVGRLVAYPDQELSGSLSDFSSRQPVRNVLQSEPLSGALTYTDLSGDEHWVAYARVSSVNWNVIIEVRAANELQSVYSSRNLAYGILVVSLLLVTAAGVALARALTQPLGALLQAVHNLAEGDESLTPLPASSIPEVSRLANAFSVLRARLVQRTAEREQAQSELRHINQQLEHRVAERTYQLEKANTRLEAELVERQRAEAALTQRENEIRSLVENVPDGIIRFDANMQPVFYSPAGRRIADWINSALNDTQEGEQTVSEALLSVEKTLLRQVLFTGEEAVLEFSIPTPDGLRYFETRYVPEFSSSEKAESVLAIWRDLTGRRIVEEALRTNEERLRISLSHAGVWVFSLDCDLRYTWVYNPPPRLKDQVFVQKTDRELFSPEDAQQLIELKKSVLRRGERARQEVELHIDGRTIAYDLALEPLRSETGDIIGALGSAIDVTEHNDLLRKTEQQQAQLEEQNTLLRSQTELLQTIFEVDPGGIAVVAGDDLIYQFANPAYRALTPYPDLDPVGRSYAEIWPPGENFRGAWLLHRILETGKPLQLDWYPQEFPDGQLRYFSFNVRRVPWQNEPALLLTMWDTTGMEEAYRRAEQAATEARLRADEAEEGRRLLQTMMHYIPEGIAIADGPEGLIRMVSHHGIQMLSAGYETGNSDLTAAIQESVPVEDHLQFWQLHHLDGITPARLEESPLMRALQHGEVVLNEEWLLGPAQKGRQIYILCNAAPLRDDAGEVVGALFSWRDISERKRAEAALEKYARQLERSNQELQDFAFIASHDLQEPLRKIQAFGDRLKEHTATGMDENSLDFLNRMQSAAQRMRGMIDDLLALSRVTTRGSPFSLVSLNRVASEVLSDLEIRIERSNAVVEVGDLPTIEADPSQMRQLLQNLITNALKFHKPGQPPTIRVSARPDQDARGKRIQLIVEDQGIGFAMEHVDRIFQPFQRLHGRSQYEGMGMGLAICQRIAERHNGTITARSAAGQGSTFLVTLPLRQETVYEEVYILK
jgi:signal transduction histidine kinase/HAMP domain-containing protein